MVYVRLGDTCLSDVVKIVTANAEHQHGVKVCTFIVEEAVTEDG